MTWNEIVDKVASAQQKAIDSGHALWFRGHCDAAFKLKSTLHRHVEAFLDSANLHPSDEDQRNLLYDEEKSLFQKFRADSWALLDSEARKPWGTLFTMQHHGLPTRLLDWTESFPGAVYFVNQNRDPNQEAAIFILDPQALNKHSISRDGLVNIEDGLSFGSVTTDMFLPNVGKPSSPLPTLAVVPIFSNERMRAQKSRFLIMGDSRLALEEQDESQLVTASVVEKIVLPASTYTDSMKWLQVIGIRHFTFFPDMQGLKMDFEERRGYLLKKGIAFAKGEE